MTIAYWCVLIAAILPYVFTVLAKSGQPKYDNQRPREYLEVVHGWRKRAHWSQLNAFEAFPSFAAAVIIAHQLHANQNAINQLAIAFIIARILHGIFYIKNLAAFRSIAWLIGFACMISLFLINT